MTNEERGLGKCQENHPASYGYPTRPEEPYPFCPQCGNAVVWACPACDASLPEDSQELVTARFCRQCGAPYFDADPSPADGGAESPRPNNA